MADVDANSQMTIPSFHWFHLALRIHL